MAEQTGGKYGARLREKRWGGVFSRTQQRIQNVLGIIPGDTTGKIRKYRSEDLNKLDEYYDSCQYENLPNWIDCNDPVKSKDPEAYVPVRKRKPLINYPFAKVLCQRVASKLVGASTYPTMVVEDDPDTQEFIRVLTKTSKLKSRIIEPVRRMLGSGSVLLRFSIVDGAYKIEHFLSKYCYPVFDSQNNLASVRVRYVYDDPTDLDSKGNPKKKWYQLDLGPERDILYDNPEYKDTQEPGFQIVKTADHGLGFVQAEWLRTAVDKHSPDGPSLYGDLFEFIDELNYSISQSSQAVMYNQDPQLFINGLSEDEIEALIKSSTKAWNLGKEGKGGFIESDLGAVERAELMRDKIRLGIQDVARVALLDPEKMVSNAQSGKAMEVLHGPMIELINELRPEIEERLTAFILKMLFATLKFANEGFMMAIQIPEGYVPQSMDITVQWPEIFPMTLEDLQKKVSLVNSLTGSSIVSREWGLRYLAKDLGIENIEEELAKIASQPVINPFGGF